MNLRIELAFCRLSVSCCQSDNECKFLVLGIHLRFHQFCDPQFPRFHGIRKEGTIRVIDDICTQPSFTLVCDRDGDPFFMDIIQDFCIRTRYFSENIGIFPGFCISERGKNNFSCINPRIVSQFSVFITDLYSSIQCIV